MIFSRLKRSTFIALWVVFIMNATLSHTDAAFYQKLQDKRKESQENILEKREKFRQEAQEKRSSLKKNIFEKIREIQNKPRKFLKTLPARKLMPKDDKEESEKLLGQFFAATTVELGKLYKKFKVEF